MWWVLPERRQVPSATIHQFALYRIVLGLVIVVSLGAASVPDTPPEAWLELPRALRGSVRFISVGVGLCLIVGFLRRAFAAAALALAAFLAHYEHISWAVAGPLVVHSALVAMPGGKEPWALGPGSPTTKLHEHFSTAAWVSTACVVSALAFSITPDALRVTMIGLAWLGVVLAFILGPRLPVVGGAFGVLVVAACLGGEPLLSLLVLLPTVLACISEDWLPSKHDALKQPIVFYDGVCGFCQRGIQVMLAEDVRGRLRFAPLQGEASSKLLNLTETDQYDTMILHEDGALFERSDAALRIAEILGGFWRLSHVLKWLPVETRDKVYDYVAENRYDWFGKLDACPVPDAAIRDRFLD